MSSSIKTHQAPNGQYNVQLILNKFFTKKEDAEKFAGQLTEAIESIGKVEVETRFLLFDIKEKENA